MKGLKKSSLTMALMLASGQALALGLGPIQVKSGLNQPLSAEIPVIADSAAEVNELRAELASNEDFQRVGLSRARVGVPIEFAVGSNGHGQTVIKLTTKDAVSEPFLDFLIEVNWAHGKLLREYTVLLDPPVAAPAVVTSNKSTAPSATPAPAVAVAPPSKSKLAPTPPVSVEQSPTPKPVASSVRPAPAAASGSTSGQYGPVEKGQTLSNIARGISDGSNLNQLMLALLKANPDAFYRDNVNALKAGAVLRIPSADEISASGSAKEVMVALRAQNQAWQQESAKPILVAQTGAPTDNTVDAKPAAAAKPAHLALVPPSAGKGGDAGSERTGGGSGTGKEGAEARAELARVNEALANRDQESTELKSQVKRLEDINEKGQKLISLKDSEIADLQNKLKELQAAKVAASAPANTADVKSPPPPPVSVVATPATDAAKPVPVPSNTVTPPSPAAPATAVTTNPPAPANVPATPAAVTPTPSTSPAAVTTTTPSPSTTPPVAATPAPAKPVVATTPPKPTPITAPASAGKSWYSDYLGDNPSMLLYIVGVLFLLIGGWVLLRYLNKPKPAATSKYRSDLARSKEVESPVEDEKSRALTADAQEQHLLDRLAQNPDDIGLSLELLRHYYVQGDATRFEALAETVHPHLKADSLEWQEISAMGEGLLPNHALFTGADGDHSFVENAPHKFAFEHTDEPANFDLNEPTSHAVGSAGDDSKFDHLGLDRAGLDAGSHPDLTTQRFDFNDLQAHAQELATRVPPASDASHASEYPGYVRTAQDDVPHDQVARDLAGFEFDGAHSELLHRAAAPQHTAEHESSLEDMGLDDDLIGTRLDLARAYLDMGDTEGARSMLDEVLVEGNEAQKDEARKLLAEL